VCAEHASQTETKYIGDGEWREYCVFGCRGVKLAMVIHCVDCVMMKEDPRRSDFV